MLGGVLAAAALVAAAFGGDDAATTTYRLEQPDGKASTAADAATAIRVLERRLSGVGAAGVKIAGDGTATLTLTVPAALDKRREEILRLAERPGTVEFRVCASSDEERRWRDISAELEQPLLAPKRYRWLPVDIEDHFPYVLVHVPEQVVAAQMQKLRVSGSPDDSPAMKSLRAEFESTLRDEVFTGGQLARGEVRQHPISGNVVWFEFKPERKQAFEAFTGRHINEQLAIVLDGRVVAWPVIKSALPGEGMIVGEGRDGFSMIDAQGLASVIVSGPLSVRLIRVPAPETK